MKQQIESWVIIEASPDVVWEALTNPDSMKKWMGEPEMNVEVITSWKAGTPVVIRGFHHVHFENRGTVLQFDPPKVLKYDYLSSVSRLPDKPENHTVVEFLLTPQKKTTSLKLTASNFPDESVYKHVEFYWRGTLEVLKLYVETGANET